MSARGFAWLLCVVCCLVPLAGCAPRNDEDQFASVVQAPLKDILDMQSMVNTPVANTTFAVGQEIPLYMKNKTTDCLVFPYDYGLRLLVLANGRWTAVRNRVTYASHKNIVLEGTGNLEDDAFMYLHPDYAALSPGSLPTKMRVVVVADACVKGAPSGSRAADYTEFSIRP